MRINQDHRLTRVRRRDSPNFDARQDVDDISLIVVHGISLPPGEFGGDEIEALFCNELDHPQLPELADYRVSAHLLIDRRGRCTQFVAFDQRAWHAGESAWRGRTGCNDFSIGIELEGTDTRPYTQAQYRKLASVIRALLAHYPRLAADAIVGHLEVAAGRKTDPGPAFNWSAVLRGAARLPDAAERPA